MTKKKGPNVGGIDPKNVHNIAPGSKNNRHTSSTSRHGSSSVPVFDGRTFVGSIIERAGWHLSHDHNGPLVDDFASRVEAMRSLRSVGPS